MIIFKIEKYTTYLKPNLVIADIPYNLGNNAYASSTQWYVDGDNKNGESKLAGKQFFNSDKNFNLAEYMHFCSRLLKPEPKEKGQAPAMIVFCSFEQMNEIIEQGKKHGFMKSYPIFFIKNYSAQTLKANMRVVGAMEYAVVLYRDKLPKFNNEKNQTVPEQWYLIGLTGNEIKKKIIYQKYILHKNLLEYLKN